MYQTPVTQRPTAVMDKHSLSLQELATLLATPLDPIQNYQPGDNPQLDRRLDAAIDMDPANPFTQYGRLTIAQFARQAHQYSDSPDLLRLCIQLSNDTKWITTTPEWTFFLAEPDPDTPPRVLILAAALADYLHIVHTETSPTTGNGVDWFAQPHLKLLPPWYVGIPEHLDQYRHQIWRETPVALARHGVAISDQTFMVV